MTITQDGMQQSADFPPYLSALISMRKKKKGIIKRKKNRTDINFKETLRLQLTWETPWQVAESPGENIFLLFYPALEWLSLLGAVTSHPARETPL